MSWTVSVLIICVAIACLACWLEYRRENPIRLLWRIVATVVSVMSLACIALPLTYHGKSLASADSEAVLLTENYNTDSLAGYKRFFTVDAAIKKTYPKTILLTNLADINNIKPVINQLHIAGYGLADGDLRLLNQIKLTYNAPALPAGIQAINWQQQLKAGEILKVQGSFNNTGGQEVKLLLKGLNTSLDSVMIPAGKIADFELSTIPKISGRAAYTLLAFNGKDTIENESLPVFVEPAKPVRVLLLSASPDFETKFLKNWLAQNGYAVAAKAMISKNKTSQEFVNMEKQPLDHLSTSILQKFDVVIGDLSTLKSLTPPEGAALKQQVEQDGLGVLIKADSVDKSASWLQNNFNVNTLSSKTPVAGPLLLLDQKNKTAPLSIDPSYINDHDNLQNLVFDAQNHILASSTLSSSGKLVFTTLHNTFTWALAGDNKDYTALWSLLINKATRKVNPRQNWAVASAVTAANTPVTLQLQSGTIPAKLMVNGAAMPTMQNPLIPYQWSAVYWPQDAGWQQINAGIGEPGLWYNYPKNSWKTIIDLKKISETKNYIAARLKIPTVTKQIQQSPAIEVPKMYFYFLLLASCTFLWVERKLTT